jgi:shikimate dehydrogenase
MRLDALYGAFDVPPASLRPVLRALILSGVEGLNVTVPLKEAVLPLMDRLDKSAKSAGAVNTIVIRGRKTTGYNTDGAGFVRALRDLGWRRPGRAVVLGAGGAARGVAWELARLGCRLTIANRTPSRARQLAARLRRAFPRLDAQAQALRGLDLAGTDLLVNATTVGMRAGDPAPADVSGLRRGAVVYDLIYHRPTALVAAARRRGCVAGGGDSMLLYQGAESLRLWLHRAPPVRAMRSALHDALRRR